jgi:TldD protein
MEKGNCSQKELIEDIDNGLYILGRGATGGEVDVGQGAFTFNVGPSYIIKKGELDEMVRGVSISGMILDTLRGVTGVGKETEIRTSVFGGCGKSGQTVRVGLGGPHVKIREMLVGGS